MTSFTWINISENSIVVHQLFTTNYYHYLFILSLLLLDYRILYPLPDNDLIDNILIDKNEMIRVIMKSSNNDKL